MKCRRRKCRCCHEWFLPQPRNAYHQRYCTNAACRQASHRMSQRRWFRKNRDYYRGPMHVERVRAWRVAHPGYACRQRSVGRLDVKLRRWPRSGLIERIRLQIRFPQTGALQDLFAPQPVGIRDIASDLNATLQDFMGISPVCC